MLQLELEGSFLEQMSLKSLHPQWHRVRASHLWDAGEHSTSPWGHSAARHGQSCGVRPWGALCHHENLTLCDNSCVRTGPSSSGIGSAEVLKSLSAKGPEDVSKWIYQHHHSPFSCAICASSVGLCRRMPPASCLSVFPCAGNSSASTKKYVVFSQSDGAEDLSSFSATDLLLFCCVWTGSSCSVVEEQRGICPWSQ